MLLAKGGNFLLNTENILPNGVHIPQLLFLIPFCGSKESTQVSAVSLGSGPLSFHGRHIGTKHLHLIGKGRNSLLCLFLTTLQIGKRLTGLFQLGGQHLQLGAQGAAAFPICQKALRQRILLTGGRLDRFFNRLHPNLVLLFSAL